VYKYLPITPKTSILLAERSLVFFYLRLSARWRDGGRIRPIMALWTPAAIGSGAPPLLRTASPSLSTSLDLVRTGIEDSHTGDTLPLPSSIWSPTNTRKGPRRRIRARSTMDNLSWPPTRVVGRQPTPPRLSSPTRLLAVLLAYPYSTSPSMASTHGVSEFLPPRGCDCKGGA
jgi:hypothetical protein